MGGDRKITIVDIGRLAGVSHTTVSRALNGSPLVKSGTRQRILDIARRLDFHFDANARSLSGRSTGMIAVVYHSDFEIFGSSLYVNQLFLEVRHNLEKYELDMILVEATNPSTGNSNIRRLVREKKVDGLLIVHGGVSRADYELALDEGLPVINLHLEALHYPMEGLDYFLTDHFEGGRLGARHLIDRGCRRLLNITIEGRKHSGVREIPDRTAGFLRGLEELGCPAGPESVVAIPSCSFEDAYALVQDRPDLFTGVDGVFASTDIIAFGCATGLKDQGLTIPSDLLLLGYDDAPVCSLAAPALSSVHQPREELAARACAHLRDLLDRPASERAVSGATHVVLPPYVVQRASTASSIWRGQRSIHTHKGEGI